MNATDFVIGDTAFIARAGHVEKWVECQDCCGKAALTVILGDDSRVSIACSCAEQQGRPGKVRTYEFSEHVERIVIGGVETRLGQEPRYRFNVTACSYNTVDAADVFETKEEALAKAAVLVAEQQAAEAEAMKRKNAKKNWAWRVTYHRRELARAKRDVEYHAARLAVAQEKSAPTVEATK